MDAEKAESRARAAEAVVEQLEEELAGFKWQAERGLLGRGGLSDVGAELEAARRALSSDRCVFFHLLSGKIAVGGIGWVQVAGRAWAARTRRLE